MFSKSARWYDAIYAFWDYAAAAQKLHRLIQERKQSPGAALLDVACGTGKLLGLMRDRYTVEGLDLDPAMLALARERLADVPLHHADMVDFELGRQFDVVICLGSSIGYTKTEARLRQAISTMVRHTQPGGLVVVEPWITLEAFRPGTLTGHFVDQPDLKIARMNVAAAEGGVSILDFQYLVGTPEGIEHLTERHELGLFTHPQYQTAFEAAGLEVAFDPQGLTGRGLYTGLRESLA